MADDPRKAPRFIVEGSPPHQRLFLHCSLCEARMREIGQTERIAIDRPYYCADCQVDIGLASHPGSVRRH